MGIFYSHPPSHIGGAQPYSPRRLSPSLLAVPEDDPPRLRALIVLAAVLTAWHADPAHAQQPRRYVPIAQEIAAQQAPSSSRLQASWVAPEFGLPQRRTLPNQILAVAVNEPPVRARVFIDASQPSWRLPPRRYAPLQSVAVEETPHRLHQQDLISRLWRVHVEPIKNRGVPVQVMAVAEDHPPQRARSMRQEITAWYGDLEPAMQPRRFTPQAGPLAEAIPYRPDAVAVSWRPFGWTVSGQQRRYVPIEVVAETIGVSRNETILAIAWVDNVQAQEKRRGVPISALAVPADALSRGPAIYRVVATWHDDQARLAVSLPRLLRRYLREEPPAPPVTAMRLSGTVSMRPQLDGDVKIT